MSESREKILARLRSRSSFHSAAEPSDDGVSVTTLNRALVEGSTVEAREALKPVLDELVLNVNPDGPATPAIG